MLRVGDAVFNHLGEPAVVIKEAEPASTDIRIDKDPAAVTHSFRHGYLDGLGDLREPFNAVMDQVRSLTDPNEKVSFLTEKINLLRQDAPTSQSIRLGKYLQSELFHTMHSYDITPRIYDVDANRL